MGGATVGGGELRVLPLHTRAKAEARTCQRRRPRDSHRVNGPSVPSYRSASLAAISPGLLRKTPRPEKKRRFGVGGEGRRQSALQGTCARQDLINWTILALGKYPSRAARKSTPKSIDGKDTPLPSLGQRWKSCVVHAKTGAKAVHGHKRQSFSSAVRCDTIGHVFSSVYMTIPTNVDITAGHRDI